MSDRNKSNEIRINRIYDAPVRAVWDAWTDPEQVAQWWGPRGFTLTTHSKDLRPGGSWVYTMHGPDGVDYPNKTLYLEVEKYSKLIYDHGASDDLPPMFRVAACFLDELSGLFDSFRSWQRHAHLHLRPPFAFREKHCYTKHRRPIIAASMVVNQF